MERLKEIQMMVYTLHLCSAFGVCMDSWSLKILILTMSSIYA